MATSKSKKLEPKKVKTKKVTTKKVTKNVVTDLQKSSESSVDFLDTNDLESLVLKQTDLDAIPTEFPKSEIERAEFYADISSQIDDLTLKIQKTDRQSKIAKAKFEEIEKITNKLTEERVAVKSLITREQDLIHGYETKLNNISSSQDRADIPFILKAVIKIFNDQGDEITLNSKIAGSETKIFQRKSRLLQINGDIAKSWIAHKGYQDALAELTKIGESFRTFRMNIGKLRREIDTDLKIKENQLAEDNIMKNYFDSVQKINRLGPTFAEALSQNREIVSGLFDQLQNVQSKALLKGSDNVNKELNEMADWLSKK